MLYRDGGPIFDLTTQGQAIDAVRAAKPKSRVFTTRAVIEAEAPLGVAAYTRTSLLATVQPYAFTGETVTAGVFVGAMAASLIDVTVQPKAT